MIDTLKQFTPKSIQSRMYVLLLSLTTTVLAVFAFVDYYQTRSDMQEN